MSIDLWNTNSGLYRKRYWSGRKLIQKKTTRKPTIVLGITFRASRLFSFRSISQCLHWHGAFWDAAICFRTSCNRCHSAAFRYSPSSEFISQRNWEVVLKTRLVYHAIPYFQHRMDYCRPGNDDLSSDVSDFGSVPNCLVTPVRSRSA